MWFEQRAETGQPGKPSKVSRTVRNLGKVAGRARGTGVPGAGPVDGYGVEEPLYDGDRTQLTRLHRADGTVIRKRFIGPDVAERLRHECSMIERLEDLPGIVQFAAPRPGQLSAAEPVSILLADAGPICLAQRSLPVGPDELLDLGIGLAQAVAAMHARGVVHRDISPGNIVLGDDQLGHPRATLIDFAMATISAEVRPEFTHHTEITGTLPYLAPEQTGRTGRPVDSRADLYALGATLYEVATGQPPFRADDPMQLIHDQLARMPTPPRLINPALPEPLSAIIMHLLEKEPDNRYQTAEGLLHDLVQLRVTGDDIRVGEHDVPMALVPPSRPVGRRVERAALAAAFQRALSGQCQVVLVNGPTGVGKTSLINELRSIVATRDGWFVAGTFDQFRRDQEADAMRQALRGVGRLLLAEPEEALADLRGQLMRSLGSSVGLMAAALPEFAAILDVAPDPGDPLTADARAVRVAVEILRAVASPERPLVCVVDDLQWANRTPLGVVDTLVSGAERIDGLLLVAAYRDDDLSAARPLVGMLNRWQRQAMVTAGHPGKRVDRRVEQLALANLSEESLAELLSDMLLLTPDRAAELAEAIGAQTDGNPYDTVELLNALRHDGVISAGPRGWQWTPGALSALSRSDIANLRTARLASMPGQTRELLESMACLGGTVELSLLRFATALSEAAVERCLEPALHDRLVVIEPGAREAVRFRHDRIRAAALDGLSGDRHDALRLRLARRLARRPELFAVAADQYLPVIDAVRDRTERLAVVGLLSQAADEAKVLGNDPVVEQCYASALRLADPADASTRIALMTGRHAALYRLARLDEADAVYGEIEALSTGPGQRADAVGVQVSSLTNRNRPRDAVNLGIGQLRALGRAVPEPDDIDAVVDDRMAMLYQRSDATASDDIDDISRPAITDPALLAAGAIMTRMMAPAYFCDPGLLAWLTLEAVELWTEHGPSPTLVAPVSHLAFVTVARRQDYRAGHSAMRRILSASEMLGYEPATFEARFLYAVSAGHWFEPLEGNVALAQRAREGLLRGGDLQKAAHTYFVTLPQLFDSAPSLELFVAEVDDGIAFAERTGNDESAIAFRAYRRLADTLGKEQTASSTEDRFGSNGLAGNTNTEAHVRLARALEAAILHDRTELDRSSTELLAVLPAIPALYLTATIHVARALALADEIRSAPVGAIGKLAAELDSVVEWLALRAMDAPVNFLHLLRLAEAERSWAGGEFQTAAVAFDAAREAAADRRSWHAALIAERAARFYLAYGMHGAGRDLLAEARQRYRDWGATAKVSQLDWAYPSLRAVGDTSAITGAIDLMGILAASKALSSETTIDGLRVKVAEVLGAMTGATQVQLLVRSEDRGWQLARLAGGGTVSLDVAGKRRLIPLSAVRYVERTKEPLVVQDATRDDPFARDPYFEGLPACSLLVVPISYGGRLRALLLLENRLIRGAFRAERLDGVMLIAGQLAVSLDNAMIYASLEQKVAERTAELALANESLERLSITDSLTGVANRRRFDAVLDAQWRRAFRLGESLGLAIIDIDHFKLYNDLNGHAAGDKCLQRVAMELTRGIREVDLVARYGGEEFAIVMPGADLAAGVSAAERLRVGVMDLAEPHQRTPAGVVTVSAGVAATVPTSSDGAAALIEAADVELYRAKRAGRNRVGPGPLIVERR